MKQHVYWQNKSTPFVLNLDKNFSPIKNHIELNFETFDFKGGEPHLKLLMNAQYYDELVITQRVNNVHDLFMIILAADAARRMGFRIIKLFCPYFPAARQDRVCNDGEALTVKVFADMINVCKFDEVTIFSPHSEVTPALLDNCKILDLDKDFVNHIVSQIGKEVNIVSPDAGSEKRVGKIVQHLISKGKNVNLIIGGKKRNTATGELTGFHVLADDLGGYPTLIVDDILSMGGTFIGLGKILKEKNCGTLHLYTSHADCMAGLEKMCGFFDGVYTTNSRQNWNDYNFPCISRLTCIPITV